MLNNGRTYEAVCERHEGATIMDAVANAHEAAPRSSALETMRILSLHFLCFVLPVASFAFLLTAPHVWYASLPWLLVVIGSIAIDMQSPREHRQPLATLPGWPFNGVLYALFFLQIANVALLVRMVALNGFFTTDTLVGFLLVGINSGYSGLVVAHELIHRASAGMQQLGRMMLVSVLYEHFYTEHIRGHHARVGTGEDPATARFGEAPGEFLLRTVPGQFRSAWRLEAKRLGDADMKWWDPRMLRSRVVHGLALEWGIALAILLTLGLGAFAIFVLQAALAVRLLEAVNYFEHWGLARTTRRVRTIDSWDTDSWFTLYTLVGLSRHADHHAHASRPYQQLRHFEESPKLRYGYFGTVAWLLIDNAGFRLAMAEELERRGLGPFRIEESAAA
jgi:alkane 1-monooxygenase